MTATTAGRVPVQTTAPLLVVATFYCTPRRGEPYYEIHLAPRELPDTRPRGVFVSHSLVCRCVVFQTRSPEVYTDALDAEGTPHRVIANWHRDGVVRVLDSLDVSL